MITLCTGHSLSRRSLSRHSLSRHDLKRRNNKSSDRRHHSIPGLG